MFKTAYILLLWLMFLPCSHNYAQVSADSVVRSLKHKQQKINTTFKVDQKFYGKYKGRKSGYLVLNGDGTGSYRYDNYLFVPEDCKKEEIPILWGFLVDDDGKIVKFERDYGYSYPVIYNCYGENSFQGCTKSTLIDYLLVYKTGAIKVSSSDDWEKSY